MWYKRQRILCPTADARWSKGQTQILLKRELENYSCECQNNHCCAHGLGFVCVIADMSLKGVKVVPNNNWVTFFPGYWWALTLVFCLKFVYPELDLTMLVTNVMIWLVISGVNYL